VDESARLVKAVTTVLTEPPRQELSSAEVKAAMTDVGLDPKDFDVAAIVRETNATIRQNLTELSDGGTFALDPPHEQGTVTGVDFLETATENAKTDQIGSDLWEVLQAGTHDDRPPCGMRNPLTPRCD
jgi:hypothetical protein